MFSRKPTYDQEQINQQVTNLERLHKLRDMCTQKSLITKDVRWDAEIERYNRNIETGQRYLDYMQGRDVKR